MQIGRRAGVRRGPHGSAQLCETAGVDLQHKGVDVATAYPLDVQFTDLSTGDPASWNWSFGDGGASTAQNPTHTYTTPGAYDVRLTATGTVIARVSALDAAGGVAGVRPAAAT